MSFAGVVLTICSTPGVCSAKLPAPPASVFPVTVCIELTSVPAMNPEITIVPVVTPLPALTSNTSESVAPAPRRIPPPCSAAGCCSEYSDVTSAPDPSTFIASRVDAGLKSTSTGAPPLLRTTIVTDHGWFCCRVTVG